jgi:hypothetical protein
VPAQGYKTYSTPFLGLHQVIRPDGLYRSHHLTSRLAPTKCWRSTADLSPAPMNWQSRHHADDRRVT